MNERDPTRVNFLRNRAFCARFHRGDESRYRSERTSSLVIEIPSCTREKRGKSEGKKETRRKKETKRNKEGGEREREGKIARPRETRADVCQMNFRFALRLVTLDKMVGERGIDPDEKESRRVVRLSDDREPVIRKYSCHICTGYITFLGSRSLRSKRHFSPMIAHRCQCFSFDRCRYS